MLTLTNEQKIGLAMEHLRQARELLKEAGARQVVKRVRLALTSAGGAQRHARGVAVREG